MTIATLIMAQETGLALYARCRGGLLVLLGAVIGMLLMRTGIAVARTESRRRH